MTDIPDLPPNVRKFERKEPKPPASEPKLPEHKQLFDEFVQRGVKGTYIKTYLARCRPDLLIQPFKRSKGEDVVYVGIDHASELAQHIDWLGGEFCEERIAFSVKPDGSLHRNIEILPVVDRDNASSCSINTTLLPRQAREFVDYVMDDPADDLEGILRFLEVDENERRQIALFHRGFRRRHFVANEALAQSGIDIDTLH
jgi:hypothetical protein